MYSKSNNLGVNSFIFDFPDNLTVAVMKEMKMIKWTEIRRNIFEVINQVFYLSLYCCK